MDACKWNGEATFFIPLGTYMIYGANFIEPCKGSLIVKIQGVIKASTNPKIFCKDSWISFEHLNNLEIEGVFDSNIGTGDDCISIFAGSQNINISGVTCGPGHGISIGSLVNKPNEVVKDVHVKNCTLIATQNGMRIKTWASSNVGEATSIYFEDIIMDKVNNPIIIDQHYCPSHTCSYEKSFVQIKDVTFNNIRGTTNSLVAVYFNCSSSLLCQNINLNDIKLITDNNAKPTIALCANAIGHATGIELPPSCLKPALES
ncbi:hypothetical protein R3W88_000533 [Solanum pinnatisectum]|uniref:Polygalacturonase n=1 Tax=Solanum pinnatisectum TaxID=50273 RepID=A0AAV9MFY6_9SOLN|nr:hypothetical protein R3W88_000533 [Solanum pinnatisectum]